MINSIAHSHSVILVDIDAVVDVGRSVGKQNALREHQRTLRSVTPLSCLVDFYISSGNENTLGTLVAFVE